MLDVKLSLSAVFLLVTAMLSTQGSAAQIRVANLVAKNSTFSTDGRGVGLFLLSWEDNQQDYILPQRFANITGCCFSDNWEGAFLRQDLTDTQEAEFRVSNSFEWCENADITDSQPDNACKLVSWRRDWPLLGKH